MFDHPGWILDSDNQWHRKFSTSDGATVTVDATDSEIVETNPDLVPDSFELVVTEVEKHPLARTLSDYRVRRLRNPSLWDAIALSIVRQVIRASHASRLYRNASLALIGDEQGPFPGPEAILEVSDESFEAAGMAFQRPKLRSAARAYIENAARWKMLSSADLYGELRAVKGLGPWSAGIVIVDYTNDFGYYPHDDLAVRANARVLWPDLDLPRDQKSFAIEWEALCGHEIDRYTAMTLAVGAAHARRLSEPSLWS
jgi:DNA-3-methyladenine glycosylase II